MTLWLLRGQYVIEYIFGIILSLVLGLPFKCRYFGKVWEKSGHSNGYKHHISFVDEKSPGKKVHDIEYVESFKN